MDEDRAFLTPPDYQKRATANGQDRSRATSSDSAREHHDSIDTQLAKPDHDGPATKLHRSTYISVLVFVYVALAASSWAVICVLAFKPVNSHSYDYINRSERLTAEDFLKDEEVFRVMRVIQAIVSVLTIPITSAVCSCAAVAYVQHNKRSVGMSMRKTMALADRGWTDPTTFVRLFS